MADQALGVDREVIGKAITEGLAEGIGVHLPGAVGLVLKGPLICAFMAFGHFLLGTDWPISVVAGGFCGLAGVNASAFLRWMDKGRSSERSRVSAPKADFSLDVYADPGDDPEGGGEVPGSQSGMARRAVNQPAP